MKWISSNSIRSILREVLRTTPWGTWRLLLCSLCSLRRQRNVSLQSSHHRLAYCLGLIIRTIGSLGHLIWLLLFLFVDLAFNFSPFNISTCWPVNLVQNKTKSRVIFILSTLGFMAQGSHNLTSGTLFLLASFTICILCAPAHLRRPCQEQCRRYIHSRAQLTPMMRLSLKKTNSDDGHRCWQHCSALAAMDNELASICNGCLARSARGNLC